MGYLNQLRRAAHLADTVDADRVTWDDTYRDAVIGYIGDETGAADHRLAEAPRLPAALMKMMARLGLTPASAWRKSEAGTRDAARVCSHCGLSVACETALPEPLTQCPNHDRLHAIKALSITDRGTTAPTGCPLA